MASVRPRPPATRLPPPANPYADETLSPSSPSPLTTSASSAFPSAASLSQSQPSTSPLASPSGGGGSFLQSSFIRDDYIQKQLALRVADFTDNVPLLLHIATWNVNAKRPDEDIGPWLLSPAQQRAYSQYDVETLDIDSSKLVEPDVYAIGFQEIVDLNAGNLLVDHNATRPWEDKIERLLKQRYVQVANKSLVGLALLVYVKRSLAEYVSDVVIEKIGVGIMGVGGNKGAVAVRMNVYDSRLCFVNSHLAAHQHNTPGRNSDYASILQKCRFTDRRTGQTYDILEHDNVFWLGDLNYRIDVHDLGFLHQKIEEEDWPYLHQHDQLIREKAAGNTFHNFVEAPVNFAPTYKYQPGTDKYERREDKKKRLPAWCDRIQWTGAGVDCLQYDRAELNVSDHKPVYGLYRLQAKVLVVEKRDAVKQQLAAALDHQENDAMPRVSIHPTAVQLDLVRFDRAVTRHIVVTNTGASMVQWAFKQRSEGEGLHKPWLVLEPQYGLIPVGESTRITVTAHVTRDTSGALMTGEDVLEDILIFGLESERDFFISVAGEYRRSAVGCSIEYLVNHPAPIRLSRASSPPASSSASVLSLPEEIWRLVDHLYQHGMDTPGLFFASGVQTEVEAMIDALDTGGDLPANATIHSVAECFVYFLKNTAHPLFPVSVADEYDGSNLNDFCRSTALSRLSPCQYNAFIYLIAFLREVLAHKDKNRLNMVQLVVLLASALFHFEVDENDPAVGLAPGKVKPKPWIILRHYITAVDFP